jgi:hypothetical protein
MTNGNDCAYPTESQYQNVNVLEGGLTKREYFAAMAMQGYLAGRRSNVDSEDIRRVVEISVKFSDGIINELNKTELK